MEKISLQEMSLLAQQIVKERDWEKFHTLKNISTNLVCEAAELLEIFTWMSDAECENLSETKHQQLEDEIGDVLFTLFLICQKTNIDLATAFLQKIEKTKQKYPVEKSRGKNVKYTEL
jgi:dCTP diphosphatase